MDGRGWPGKNETEPRKAEPNATDGYRRLRKANDTDSASPLMRYKRLTRTRYVRGRDVQVIRRAIWRTADSWVSEGTARELQMQTQELLAHYAAGQRDFHEASLVNAALSGERLSGIDLRFAALNEVDFTDAELWGADLRHARLDGADLRGADLRRADLRGARLCGAMLCGTNLEGAILDSADVSDVCWYDPALARLRIA